MLYDNILVPYDGSSSSQAALREAVRYAKADPGLTLRIIHIVDSEQLVIDKLEGVTAMKTEALSPADLKRLHDEAVDEASAYLHQEIDSVIADLMGKIYLELLEETTPGEQIVTYAAQHDCDLIIMGSRGLGAFRGMLGSVSSHVLRSAAVPVLIVKQEAIK